MQFDNVRFETKLSKAIHTFTTNLLNVTRGADGRTHNCVIPCNILTNYETAVKFPIHYILPFIVIHEKRINLKEREKMFCNLFRSSKFFKIIINQDELVIFVKIKTTSFPVKRIIYRKILK